MPIMESKAGLMLFLAKQALLSERMMAFETCVMSEGKWNAGKERRLEQTPGLHAVLGASLHFHMYCQEELLFIL